jgi:diguanylate cyclase
MSETPPSDRDPAELEGYARPLLEALREASGYDSTYLTLIEGPPVMQHVLFACNGRAMQIPEGFDVPWGQSVCKRALAEGLQVCEQVQQRWPDVRAASELGIVSYASEPLRASDGTVLGTLCAAAGFAQPLSPQAARMIGLFAGLIAERLEREQRIALDRRAQVELAQQAFLDPLTGLANRRQLHLLLGRMWERWRRQQGTLAVAYLDCDGFKAINDDYGHTTGDAFLIALAQRLQAAVRPGDLVARVGGDEFAIATLFAADAGIDPATYADRLAAATVSHYALPGGAFDYAGVSVGLAVAAADDAGPEALLSRADAAMYASKRARRAAVPR